MSPAVAGIITAIVTGTLALVGVIVQARNSRKQSAYDAANEVLGLAKEAQADAWATLLKSWEEKVEHLEGQLTLANAQLAEQATLISSQTEQIERLTAMVIALGGKPEELS